ncbi:synaptopodin-2 isoform X2 [Dunckerocampus dactyliophorus]|nr:synaptopodin-2 isoform X2 [Dunckerocampus dactyliophorus]XP_054609412.1 synaptopodin-2 isoform X2 [Dunckerocampus dactyliophorus]
MDTSSNRLQLLVKRSATNEALTSCMKYRSQNPTELYISESQDEASDGDQGMGGVPVDMECTSLGSAHSIKGDVSTRGSTTTNEAPSSIRKPLSQYGVVQEKVSSASAGRGLGRSQSGAEDGGGPCEGPGSFRVAFEFPSDEGTPAEEEEEEDSDQEKPSRHRARHARLRRSESLSEKQVKEAKSKCKRIALLLTTAPPNPNNKGLLMFKKHQQRAKKYTLVSYGTGEDEQDSTEEEDGDEEGHRGGIHVLEFTVAAQDRTNLEEHFSQGGKGVLTISLQDKGLLGQHKQMECLPDTKGKGALMFAQRRQRMDEIAAEHEELRRQGIPVEGVQERQKVVEPSYMQSATEDHVYMDVNVHQQQYQQQQYQQQQYQQYQQVQQQKMYHQEFPQNGSVHHQSSEMQRSLSNRTAKPFSVQNMAASPYSTVMSGADQESTGQGEQIASRDERISTPASRTGLLDSKRRNAGKPMFTFKEAPKVSPNPELLNLLNMSKDKKTGFESGPEEDYLSLGAEACNFLQSARLKHKTPPPVAPKPMINPSATPWSPQMDMPQQHAENSACPPAVAPTAETTPSTDREPISVAPEPSPPQAAEKQQTWPPSVPETQQVTQVQEGNAHANSSPQPDPGRMWDSASMQTAPQQSAISCGFQVQQPQDPPPTQSPSQQPWATHQPALSKVQAQPPAANTWQPSWTQPEQEQPPAQPSWCPPQESPQTTWTQEPQVQPTWGQAHTVMPQQSQTSWTQVQSQSAWPQHKAQAQPPWVQPESQPQPPWCQPAQPQTPPQAWSQTQAPDQHWVPPQPQQQPPINSWPPSQPPWTQAAQAQPPVSLNPWAPVPAQPTWTQQAPEQVAHATSSWGATQDQVQQQSPWVQPARLQPSPQPTWQTPKPPPQPAMNAWPPAQPQTPVNTWAPQSQQTPTANTHPLPKPWQQNRSPAPLPAQQRNFASGQRVSSPVNPLATILNPSSAGSAFEMPAVKGKGADMFAKRQSRMEKYVVDSETVQANMASRSTSPAASLPNEWKYTPNVRAPPSRAFNPIQSPSYPPAASKQPPSSGPVSKSKKKGKPAAKPLNVIDVMKHQPYQLSASLFTYGPAAEFAKESKLSCSPPSHQAPLYEQMSPDQPAGTFSPPYPQQAYEPMQPMPHDGTYQPTLYPPSGPYQQPPGGPSWVAYNQQPNPQYQPPPVPYQTAANPPYLSPAYQQPHTNIPHSFPVASPPESTSGGNSIAAPKPKFTARKSSAQVWKPTGIEKE